MLCNSKTGIPVFDAEQNGTNQYDFVLSGGGGSAKSGVPNSICTFKLGPRETGIPGVSISLVTRIDTASNIAEKCCYITATKIACLINSQVIFYDIGKGEEAIEIGRQKIDLEVSAIRCYQNKLFVGTEKGVIFVFEELDNFPLKQLKTLYFHVKSILDFSFKGNYLVSTGADDCLRIWNLETLKGEQIIPSDTKSSLTFRKAKFNSKMSLYTLQAAKNKKDASFLVLFNKSNTNKEWIIEKIKKVSNVLATALAISEDDRYVAVGDVNLRVIIFDQISLNSLRIVDKVHGLPVTSMFFRKSHLEQLHLVSTSGDATCAMILVEDLANWKMKACFRWIIILISTLFTFVVFLFLIAEQGRFSVVGLKDIEGTDGILDPILAKMQLLVKNII